MSRNGKVRPIVKRDMNGKVVATFDYLKHAARAEGCAPETLIKYVAQGLVYKNAMFSYKYKADQREAEKRAKNAIIYGKKEATPFPWEGKDGFFNIDGWASIHKIK